MKFDTIIIGGGLAGLVCGLRLQKNGQKCAVVAAGQNAMHFFSGGFGLLSRLDDGTRVDEPLKAIPSLGAAHPYSKIGAEKIASYDNEIKTLLKEVGIPVEGDATRNRYVISASGALKPAWLTVEDIASVADKTEKIGSKALIINVEGFLDFNTSFIAESLEKRGTACRIAAVTTDEIRRLRQNPSEMRATNIARLLDKEEVRTKLTGAIKALVNDEDCIILPAVFGLKDNTAGKQIAKDLKIRTLFIGTLPPSVAGIRYQMALKTAFEAAGGTFLKGDEAVGAEFDGDKVTAVRTANMGDILLTGENYILASGSYFGHGLISDSEKVYEPVFGADVIFNADRNTWYDKNFFHKQEYIGFGVDTDEKFHVRKEGRSITNLYASGSVLGGFNPLHEGCGAGVALMTAFNVTDSILGR